MLLGGLAQRLRQRGHDPQPVSYTHLDVYKRQVMIQTGNVIMQFRSHFLGKNRVAQPLRGLDFLARAGKHRSQVETKSVRRRGQLGWDRSKATGDIGCNQRFSTQGSLHRGRFGMPSRVGMLHCSFLTGQLNLRERGLHRQRRQTRAQ